MQTAQLCKSRAVFFFGKSFPSDQRIQLLVIHPHRRIAHSLSPSASAGIGGEDHGGVQLDGVFEGLQTLFVERSQNLPVHHFQVSVFGFGGLCFHPFQKPPEHAFQPVGIGFHGLMQHLPLGPRQRFKLERKGLIGHKPPLLLMIDHFHLFAQPPQSIGNILHKPELEAQVQRQVRVLVRRVHGPADHKFCPRALGD